MRRRILTALVNTLARRAAALMEAILPGPDDDLMAVAEAAGVTAEQQEARDYHLGMCEFTEQLAEVRSAMTPVDFAEWESELHVGGESR